MGEVYRARDTRLDRTVAIKVIPQHLAAEAEVRQRFEREARAVSALNHPNICVLHDVGHESSTHFFVMEMLEGETLASRLENGALSREEFFPVAVQIADALAAAHRAGIVHRDLKPGNIVLTRSGAKLLDFGLARGTGLATVSGSGLTQSPTVGRPLTAEGTIVGTFQYMAPEQLEGRDADARTDLFAFGAVLYEMATGKRAFEGESQASLIAAIIKEMPRPMSEIIPLTPPALEHVVRRCLAKRPDDRWQNASDVKHQLEWIRDAGSQAGVPAPVAVHRRQVARASWMLAVVSTVALVALGSYMATHRAQPASAVRFNTLPPPGHTFDVSQVGVAVSPDGKSIAMAVADSTGAFGLWIRRLDSIHAVRLNRTDGAGFPFWSPDGAQVAYFAAGKLFRISIADGNVQTIADAPDPRGGTWGRNGDIVFQPASAGPLMRVRAGGGEVHAVTALDTANGEEAHRFPSFLPDGKHFLFVALPMVNELFSIRIGSLDGDMTAPIARAGGAAVFAGPDFMVYPRDQQLYAHRLDLRSRSSAGDPIALGEQAGAEGGWSGAPGASCSVNGVLAHASGGLVDYDLSWVDRTGRRIGRLAVPSGAYGQGALSRDGTRYIATRFTIEGGNLWMIDVERGQSTRFTFADGYNAYPLWSPDQRDIVFVSNREGREQIFVKPASGAQEERKLFDAKELFTKGETFTPDGKFLIFNELNKTTGLDIGIYEPGASSSPAGLLATRFHEADAIISPDGRWMAYRSDESGSWQMYVRSFPDMTEKYRVSSDRLGASSTAADFWVHWRADGREIVYPGADNRTLVSVAVTTGASFHAGEPRALLRLPLNTFWVAMHPSGDKFLVTSPSIGGTPEAHTVVMNWTRLLDRN
jgi:serine/threonine protein kinase/Tol biopolymer transport system component